MSCEIVDDEYSHDFDEILNRRDTQMFEVVSHLVPHLWEWIRN